MATRKGVIACAIIKNEPDFAATIASLRLVMGDALKGIVVHDTGSDTVESLRALTELDGGDAHLFKRAFDDFASARNACLADARKIAKVAGAQWLFMFSAGAAFSGSWRSSAGQALAHTERCGDYEFRKVGPIRAGSRLRYVGRTHESIDAGRVEELPHCGITVDYSADFDAEKKARRYMLDIELLAEDYSPRGRFYLAQSFKGLGRYNEAFCYYLQRLDMNGYGPERLQACCGAVQTAPTLRAARFAASFAPYCADVQLSLAEREVTDRDYAAAERAVILASVLEDRSMFAYTKLHQRCAELTQQIAEGK